MRKKNVFYLFVLLGLVCISCKQKKQNDYMSDLKFYLSKDTIDLDINIKDGFFLSFIRNDSVFFIAYDNYNNLKILKYDNNCNCIKIHKEYVVSDTVFGLDEEFGKITKSLSLSDSLFWFYKSRRRGLPQDLFLYDFSKNEKIFSFKTTHDDFVKNELNFLIFDQFVINSYNNKLVAYVYSMEEECSSIYFDGDFVCYLAEISCNTVNNKQFIQLQLPDIYENINNGDYSFDSFIYLTKGLDNTILVSFALSPQVLLLNGSTMSYDFIETKHANYRVPIKNDLSKPQYVHDNFIRNAYRTFAYYELIYNPYRQEYYRFYQTEMPDKREDGTFTTPQDMKKGVFVMTKDFEPIGDYLFKEEEMNSVVFQNSFPTKKGFVSFITISDDKIVFARFEKEQIK